jgi:hypothetical protein
MLLNYFHEYAILLHPNFSESTQRKQAIFNKGSLFYSHCGCGLPLYGLAHISCARTYLGVRCTGGKPLSWTIDNQH